MSAPLSARIFVAVQSALPQHTMSRAWGWLMQTESYPPLSRLIMRVLVRVFGIDLHEAKMPELAAYNSVNQMFTRQLQPNARPIHDAAVVSPCDGTISAVGNIDGSSVLHAKGHHFSASTLLADDTADARYAGGRFATIYLAPGDYHRVHMPAAGELQRETFVPGRLYSVSDGTAAAKPGLFALNERLACEFATEDGSRFAVVLVGALLVGSISTAWGGMVQPGRAVRRSQPDSRPRLAAGDYLGHFNMGSTVIILLPPGTAAWHSDLQAGNRVRMGISMIDQA